MTKRREEEREKEKGRGEEEEKGVLEKGKQKGRKGEKGEEEEEGRRRGGGRREGERGVATYRVKIVKGFYIQMLFSHFLAV